MGLAVGSLVALSNSRGFAETINSNNYYYDYLCKGPLTGDQEKTLKVQVSIPDKVLLGQPLKVDWAILNESPFRPTGAYIKGAKVSVLAVVAISNLWDGTGTLESKGELVTDVDVTKQTVLGLPKITSGSYMTGAEVGEIKVAPRAMKIGFTPAKATVQFNDADTASPVSREKPVSYAMDWTYQSNHSAQVPKEEWVGSGRDRQDDVHYTKVDGAAVSIDFEGTGIEYVGERHEAYGDIEVELVDSKGNVPKGYTPEIFSPSKKSNDSKAEPVEKGKRHGGETLWSKTNLPYGEYTAKFTAKITDSHPFALVDGFNVINKEHATPPEIFDTTCEQPDQVTVVSVKVEKDPTPTPTNTTPTPRPTVTVTATAPNGSSTTTSAPTPTLTVTTTVTPTRATPTAPQVAVTPSGGAQTGEAPDGHSSGAGLIGAGAVMVFGSAWGGMALMRRRAAYVRGRG
ncbi:hypothetical protein [Streptosporangium sp. NPDC087985]|uniref:hypothetical protein n=1 Tax=Streptosporangium sp. NPDC087985 TaxID=3366196 RepID=UPI003810FC98